MVTTWVFLQLSMHVRHEIYFAGNQPPGVNPTKMQYIAKDLMRLAKHTQVPMRLPSVSYVFYYLQYNYYQN